MNITNKIYTIRGQKVMLDRDLAEIYGYTTKALNQQVKNNKEKFEGEEFMFQLTQEELDDCLRCKFCTLNNSEFLRSNILTSNDGGDSSLRSNFLTIKNGRGEHSKYLPHAFTEQGIYMLMTVLKGELAVKQSRMLVMAFKTMKDYIAENKVLLDSRASLAIGYKVSENAEKIEKIDAKVSKLADEMNEVVKRTEISPVFLDFSKSSDNKEFLLFDGEPVRAKEAYMEIYKQAKKKIYIIDNYVNIKTLHLLQIVKQKMEVTIFTDNVRNYLRKTDLDDFMIERPDLKIDIIKTNGKIHDRFIILDEKKVHQAGGSSKDAGTKITTIHEITEKAMVNGLLSVTEKMKSSPKVVLR